MFIKGSYLKGVYLVSTVESQIPSIFSSNFTFPAGITTLQEPMQVLPGVTVVIPPGSTLILTPE